MAGQAATRRLGFLALLLGLSAACATSSRTPARPSVGATTVAGGTVQLELPAAFSLEFVDVVIFPFGTVVPAFGERPMGGLSSITPTGLDSQYAVVSDESSSPRLMRFRIDVEADRLHVEPIGAEIVARPPGLTLPGAATDHEGLACFTDRTCYLSSEGNQEREPRIAPSIIGYRDGNAVDPIALPDRFLPTATGPPLNGVRRNEAFEALGASADGLRLYAVSERALVQDGSAPAAGFASPSRVVVFERRGARFRPGREYVYRVDGVTWPPDYVEPTGSRGIVEILPLADGTALTMERSFVQEQGGAKRARNDIDVYRTSFVEADDVSGLRALTPERLAKVRAASKTKVLSLEQLASVLPPPLRDSLDNFEGMTVGPRLADGATSLLLVSDDNFSKTQVTAFLLLRVVAR